MSDPGRTPGDETPGPAGEEGAPPREERSAAPGRTPGWVPAAVVAGAVLLVEGLIVEQIGAEGDEGTGRVVGDIAAVSMTLGGLALCAGYFAFLAARVALASAFEAFVLSAVTVVSYLLGWHALLGAVSGRSADLWFVSAAGLAGKGAAVAAVVGILLFTAGFALALRQVTRVVWPYFRSGVALNVLAMVHLVVLLFGTVSALNRTLTPRLLGTGVDLTETDRFTLHEKTVAILGEVEGDLKAFLIDYPGEPRSAWRERTRDLLQAFTARNANIEFRTFDPYRDSDALRQALQAAGMESVLGSLTGDDDVVVFGYRPPGEKLHSRTRVVPIDAEFSEVTALGNRRFRGEGILANAINEVVFLQRRVYFTTGHGEQPLSGGTLSQGSLAGIADALRSDNYAVATHDTAKDPAIPADAALVVIAAPRSPFSGTEVEGLRDYLSGGGSLAVLLDVSQPGVSSGLGGLLATWGIDARENMIVVSYSIARAEFGMGNVSPSYLVQAGREEFGPHAAMEALRRTSFTLTFPEAIPVLRAEKVPEGARVEELVFAPREIAGQKPWAAVLLPGRGPGLRPQPGDIVNRRLPLAVAAEREVGSGEKGGGRLVVFGDASFLTDGWLAQVPPNRTVFLNVASWAVRRDLVAIDPKTVESETVSLRPVDRELSFWTAVVALPLITLGIALGVWWNRRR